MACSYYTFRQGDFYCMKKQDYVNSDTYYKYCRNYDYDDCPIYKHDSSGGCYITSACMYSRGLADDCHELTIMRAFRDNWLMKRKGGKSIIEEYYATAPKIVSAINETSDSKSVYDRIYEEMVLPCVKLIEQEKNQEAFELYTIMTKQLASEFC